MISEEQLLIPGLPDDVAAYCFLWVDYARITVLASVCRRWKKELHSANFLRRRRETGTSQSLFAFLVQEEINPDLASYVTYIALFDPKSDQWLRIPPVPACSETERDYEIVQAGHRILAIGTWNADKGPYVPTVYIYDLLARTWRLGAPSCSPHRENPTCASDGVRRVFLAGGTHCYGFEDSRTAVMYDADDDTWQSLPDMAKTRSMCEGYFYDGVFYVLGCHSADHPTLDDCGEQYDVSIGNWTTITDYPNPSYCCCDRGFMLPDGNYYKLEVEERKLMVKKDRSWSFVGNLAVEICTIDYWVPFAWKGGFVMTKHWDIPEPENIVYMLSLTADGNHNINSKVVKMPSEYKSGLVIAGCCLEV